MNLEQLTEFFRLMTLINAVILIFSSVMIMIFRDFVARLHGKLFGLTASQVAVVSYGYLGALKLMLIVFNLVPFVSLWLLST